MIEEFLDGEEASFIVMVDGEHVLPMATSQDHKRVGDGDSGPNTGGMGAYSPAPVVTAEVHQRVMDEVIYPTVRGMAAEGNVYTGFLYAGLMIDKAGKPKVIEFNCRFGDPETQPIMCRLESSLVLLVEAALAKALNKVEATWDPRPTVGVVLAAGGYPGDYAKGDVIEGLDEAAKLDGKVFHAGTALNAEGQVVTAGGRVLCATAIGRSVSEAQQQATAWRKRSAGMAVSTARTSATAPSPASAARVKLSLSSGMRAAPGFIAVARITGRLRHGYNPPSHS